MLFQGQFKATTVIDNIQLNKTKFLDLEGNEVLCAGFQSLSRKLEPQRK